VPPTWSETEMWTKAKLKLCQRLRHLTKGWICKKLTQIPSRNWLSSVLTTIFNSQSHLLSRSKWSLGLQSFTTPWTKDREMNQKAQEPTSGKTILSRFTSHKPHLISKVWKMMSKSLPIKWPMSGKTFWDKSSQIQMEEKRSTSELSMQLAWSSRSTLLEKSWGRSKTCSVWMIQRCQQSMTTR